MIAIASRADTMHVVARVGAARFAFRVADVEEVIDAPPLLPVPRAGAMLVGQFAHRGRTVTAYDAASVFGAGSAVARSDAVGTALVLRVADERAALLVDDVEDLTQLDAGGMRPVPAGADPAGVLRGVCLPRAGGEAARGLIGVVHVAAAMARARDGARAASRDAQP